MASRAGFSESTLTVEKKAWFLCKFLCQSLNEENFEKVRLHVSNCKGVKTRVKLSPKGWSVGYKPSHVRHFNQKLPYETFPIDFIEDIFPDAQFINVLLCVFRMQSVPGIEFEIVAYKFVDSPSCKQIEELFQVLVGNARPDRLNRGPVARPGRLNLVPARGYPMGTLATDKWSSRERSGGGDSTVEVSEVAYGRSGYTSALPYGTIVPGDALRRRALVASGGGSDRHTIASQSTDDPNEINSYGSSDVVTYREVAVMVNLDKSPYTSDSRPVLHFQRSRSYHYDGAWMADVGCQVYATEEGKSRSGGGEVSAVVTGMARGWVHSNGHSSTGMRSEGSVASGPSSTDDLDEATQLFSNGVSLSYSNVRNPRQNNVAITSMDVIDGRSRATSPLQEPGDLTSTVRRVYTRGGPERGRTPISEIGISRHNRGQSESSQQRLRSRSVEPLHDNFRYLTVSRPTGSISPRPLDAVSTRSQSSYYLDPGFTKVYAPRRNQHVTYSVYAPPSSAYQGSTSRLYADRDDRRIGKY